MSAGEFLTTLTDGNTVRLDVIGVEAKQTEGTWHALIEFDITQERDGYHHVFRFELSRDQLAGLCESVHTAVLVLLTGHTPLVTDESGERDWEARGDE